MRGAACLAATLLAAGLSFGPLVTRGLAGGGTEPVTRPGTGGTRFTVNGRPAFLFGVSYYGALGAPDETVRQDLADLKEFRELVRKLDPAARPGRPLLRGARLCASGRVGDFFGMELIEYVKALESTDMEPTRNALGQPIGFPLPGWAPPSTPPREPMHGRYCRLEPLDPDRHAEALFEADAADADGRSWTYLAYGPFRTLSDYRGWMGATCLGDDPLFFAILDPADGKAAGVASYLRITPAAGSIEVGHIHYSPRLQRSPAATEAMFLMMRWAFESGYRRYEWKCDALNAASRAAAQRLGLSFEGVFRQAAVCKGRNRDTAWYAAIDAEWPALREAFLAWLDPGNFDGDGRQRTRLSDRTRPLLKQRG